MSKFDKYSDAGKTGLAVPVGVNGRGGANLVRGEDQLEKIISLAFMDGSSDNPFQNLGFDITFSVNESETKSKVVNYANILFKGLKEQDRAELSKIEWEEGNEGELIMNLFYINLENTGPEQISVPFARATLGG